MTAAALVAEIEARLEPAAIDANRAAWDVNVEATADREARRVETEMVLSDLLADDALLAAVRDARGHTGSPLLRRQLDLLHDLLLPRQVPAPLRRRIVELETAVEARFSAHRGVVHGREVTDNEILAILLTSDDLTERREAWEASKTIGAVVADDVRELARLRNEAARTVGWRDWFALAVATMEMDERRLLATLDEADRATAEPYARWKAGLDEKLSARFSCQPGDLKPWHYADPFFQEVPPDGGVDLDPLFAERDVVELGARTFDGLGVDVRGVLARSDLYPRDRKCQHAFCLDVDRAGDVRVLCNVVPDSRWMDTVLHELGHAAFSSGHDDGLPWLLRDCHLTTTEGIAMLMGRLASDAEWLTAVAGLSAADAAELEQALRARLAASHLVLVRWVLVMTSFERRLYADPDCDLDSVWWELVSRYQLVRPPEGRRAPDWAAKIHIACSPVYYHTYLYGNLTASQLAATLRAEVGGIVDRPRAGALLAERVFAPGLSRPWDDLVAEATGERLTVRHYAAEIEAGLPR
jgi:peptidyl-dipeptidase A